MMGVKVLIRLPHHPSFSTLPPGRLLYSHRACPSCTLYGYVFLLVYYELFWVGCQHCVLMITEQNDLVAFFQFDFNVSLIAAEKSHSAAGFDIPQSYHWVS